MKKDIFTLLGGFLTALLFFFGTIGVSFDWFTTESINAFVIVVSAFAALAVNVYAVWKNTHISMRIKQWLRKKESQRK
ncbi:PTS mannose transporter subunit IID [Priestia megaterium]|uniref:PTS mannose transporter subunit IID n=1 Tax=Priestia megaterium TaxID=1404 RepID=UPI0023DA51FF|nr:PTS mannose transporter subunit IID [Priestia megaterium]MDF2056288.1 PTS mannose transporter subunit IID [Priestia megaterium]MDF2060250.1 PTS mannose transporter subunit IID [Priestia megaterium]